MSNHRPFGVSLIGWLMILNGIFSIAVGALILSHKGQTFIAALDIADSDLNAYGIATIVVGAVVLLVGLGLRSGNNLVRMLVAGVWLAQVAVMVWAVIQLHSLHWSNALWPVLITSLAAAYLLFDEDAKAFFGARG
jgi:FtsH-binding integral membrane protein